jgi:cyclopropane fatty-acyl-phospholipid synthase-like methyltransferase
MIFFKKFLQKLFTLRLRQLSNLEKKFNLIYRTNYWNSKESISGPGSTLIYTENIRKELPIIFKKFSIKSILDIPCGDFNWMRYVLISCNVSYTGADIVSKIIKNNTSLYSCDKINFTILDLTSDFLGTYDLIICRDIFFHLSFNDIFNSLENIIKSRSKYVLITSHIKSDSFYNHDISSGDFRRLNLFAPPFNLPEDKLIYRFDDWINNFPEREMCLWEINDLKDSFLKYSYKV